MLSNSQIDGGEGRVGKQQSQRELAATQEREREEGREERKRRREDVENFQMKNQYQSRIEVLMFQHKRKRK